ncbi:MAG: glycosyltransferase family 32 protein [Granulosicoccus sp.]
MTSKFILNQQLDEAASLRTSGRFTEAHALLESLQSDPDSALLGHTTSIGLPRRLHSAFLKLAKAQCDGIRSVGFQYHLVPQVDVLNKYAKFTLSERKSITDANRLPVPELIHQIWIGSMQAPVGVDAWREHADTHGYVYQLWQEDNLRELGIEDNTAYQSMRAKGDLPGAVDVARYLILKEHGGVYLDCDWYPVRNDISFHDLLPMTGLVTMAENTPRNTGKGSLLLANSFIAAPKDHPVFTRLIDALAAVTTELPKAPAWWSTGPLLYTLMCRGGSVTLADADIVAGQLPQEATLSQVKKWCEQTSLNDSGLLLAWRSWQR